MNTNHGLSSPVTPGKLISAVRNHTLSSAHQAALRFSSRVASKEASSSIRTTGATLSHASPGTKHVSALPKSHAGLGRHKSNTSLLASGPGAVPRSQASVIQGQTWAAPVSATQSLQNMPGGALKQASVLSRQIEALSVRIQQQKHLSTPGSSQSCVDSNRRPQWKADARTLLRPASAPCKKACNLTRQASLPCVGSSEAVQVCSHLLAPEAHMYCLSFSVASS